MEEKNEVLRKIIQDLSENKNEKELYRLVKDCGTTEELQKIPYEYKRRIYDLLLKEELDSVVMEDKSFVNELKNDFSIAACKLKCEFRKDNIETKDLVDADAMLEKSKLDYESFCLDAYKLIKTNDKYCYHNNIKTHILMNKEIAEKLVDNPKYKDDILEKKGYILTTYTKSEKVMEKYVEYLIDKLQNDNTTRRINKNSLDYIQWSDATSKRIILEKVLKKVKIDNLSEDTLNTFVSSSNILNYNPTPEEEIESEKMLRELFIGQNFELLKGKSDNFIKEFISHSDNVDRIRDLTKNEEYMKKILNKKDIFEELIKKKITPEEKVELLRKTEFPISLGNFNEDEQMAIAEHYEEFKEQIKLEKYTTYGVENNVMKILLEKDPEFMDGLPINFQLQLFRDGVVENPDFIREQILKSEDLYIMDSIPKEVLNVLSKTEKEQIFHKINLKTYIKTLEETKDSLMEAYKVKKVEDELKSKWMFEADNLYLLADGDQKVRIIEKASALDLIKIINIVEDKETLIDYLFNKEELVSNIPSYNTYDLLKKINPDKLEEYIYKMSPEKIVDLSVNYNDKETEFGKKIEEIQEELLKNDPNLYGVKYKYFSKLVPEIAGLGDSQKESLLEKLPSNVIIKAYTETVNMDKKVFEKVLLSRYLNDEIIEPTKESIAFLDTLPNEIKENLISKMSIDKKINLLNSAYGTNLDIQESIISTLKMKNSGTSSGYVFSHELSDLISKCKSIDEKKELVSNFKVSDLISLSDPKYEEVYSLFHDEIMSRYESEIGDLSEIADRDFRIFYRDLDDESKEKINQINKKYLEKQKEGMDENSRLYSKFSSDDIDEQHKIIKLINKGYITPENHERIEYMLEKNQYVFKTVDADLFSENFAGMDVEFLEKISRYPYMQKFLIEEKDNSKLKYFEQTINSISEEEDLGKNIPLIDSLYRGIFKDKENFEFLDNLEDKLSANQIENLKEYMLRQKQIIYGCDSPQGVIDVSIENGEDLENYKENLLKRCDEIFYDENTSLYEKKNALANKYFGMTLVEMRMLKDTYKHGLDTLKNKEDTFAKNAMYVLDGILEEDNLDIIINQYKQFGEKGNFLTREAALRLDQRMKEEVTKEFCDDLYQPRPEDLVDMIEYNGNKIPVYEPSGDFKLLVHSTAAYSEMEILNDNYRDSWNESDRTSNHGICCSVIGKRYLGTAAIKDVLPGFGLKKPNQIQYSAPYDIYTRNDSFQTTASRKVQYMNGDEILDYTVHAHNETTIERVDKTPPKERREEDRKYNNIQFDYVIIFDDMTEEQKNKAIKCASDCHIPVYRISKERCARECSEEIDDLINQYEETKDVSLMKKIVNLHESNRSGFRLERQDLVKKYFPTERINTIIKKMTQDTIEKYNADKVPGLKDMSFIHEFVAEEIGKFDITNETVARANYIDIDLADCGFDLEKELMYNAARVTKLDKVVDQSYDIYLDENELKELNKIEFDAFNEKLNATLEEKESYEKRLFYTKKQLEMSELPEEEKKKILRMQKYEIYNGREKSQFLASLNMSSLTDEKKVVAMALAASEVDDSQLQSIAYRFNANEEVMEKAKVYSDIMKNSRAIENGEIDDLDISDEEKEKYKKLREDLNREYMKLGGQNIDDKQRPITGESDTII